MANEQFTREGDAFSPDVIAENPLTPNGKKSRQLMRWRVPDLGFVDMYVNPQSLSISEKKVLSKKRTKGGYIIQYWGEELITLKISGNTGSSGIEGINVLRSVYRAEQNAFQQVAQQMADTVNSYNAGGALSNLISGGANRSAGSLASSISGSVITGLMGKGANPSLMPTLGSLAVSVELFYQGWVFKGIFEDFSVTESVANGVGVFDYSLSFTCLARRGERTNFMPFHKSPVCSDPETNKPLGYYKSGPNTPMSFGGEENK